MGLYPLKMDEIVNIKEMYEPDPLIILARRSSRYKSFLYLLYFLTSNSNFIFLFFDAFFMKYWVNLSLFFWLPLS